MNGDFHFLDIIFFAAVAAFLVLRLRSVLGKRTGNERPPTQWQHKAPPAEPSAPNAEGQTGAQTLPDNVVALPTARRPAPEPLPEGEVGDGIAAIRARDPNFSQTGFLQGARAAFEMIVGAYAAGDKNALRPLLAKPVHASFAAAIDDRKRNAHVFTSDLVGISKAEITDARLDGTEARVTVLFVSEQINAVTDSQGTVIEGDPSRVIQVRDRWTFTRDTRSRDPNWQVAATASPDDLT